MKIQLQQYDVLTSTNETAVCVANQGAAEGTVIVATRQEGGHGRMQRRWESPEGGLWFSIILRPQVEPQFVAQVTLLAGVAVAKGLRRLYATDKVCIKWPNDLLWNGKKVCGILSEMQLTETGNVDYAVVGIGVNVAQSPDTIPPEVRSIAAVLNDVEKAHFSCQEALEAILEELQPLYADWQKHGFAKIFQEWQALNCTLGKQVNVKDNDEIIFKGIADSIDEQGALRVIASDGEIRTYCFGEISIR